MAAHVGDPDLDRVALSHVGRLLSGKMADETIVGLKTGLALGRIVDSPDGYILTSLVPWTTSLWLSSGP